MQLIFIVPNSSVQKCCFLILWWDFLSNYLNDTEQVIQNMIFFFFWIPLRANPRSFLWASSPGN